ncbi:MTAP family purine nucleoside phosphorylase [Nanoarchaeota archaeon]
MKERLGLIGGSIFFDGFLEDLKPVAVKTDFGEVEVLADNEIVYVQRHGKSSNIPPHKINYKANIAALKELGVKKIVGMNSVGSVAWKIKPSSIVVPTDYINLWNDVTFFDKEIQHITPGLDEELRLKIISIAKKAGVSVTRWGIYFQSRGPRLETKAEVIMIKKFAEIVGMTMANEATLAKEMGLKYAAICSVDNYAHGMEKKPLKEEEIAKLRKQNVAKVKKLIVKIIEEMKNESPDKKSSPEQ